MQQISKTETLKVDKSGDVKGTFRIPLDIMKSLKYRAIDENVSTNSLVVKALRELLSRK
jgi:hypothetical protein